MFSYEDYYKLYNVPIDAKYQETRRYLEKHVAEMNIASGKGFRERMLQYSKIQAAYLVTLCEIEEKWQEDYLRSASMAELKEDLRKVHEDTTTAYDRSTVNPAAMLSVGGKEIGPFLSAFAALFRQGAPDAFSHRRFALLKLMELYIELHKILLHGQVHKEALLNLYRSFIVDSITESFEVSFLQRYSPNEAGFTEIVEESTLTEPYYLFAYGLPLGRNDFLMHRFFNELPEETIERLAVALTDGFENGLTEGYRRCHRQLVGVSLVLGTERLTRKVMEKLREKGYSSYVYQARSSSVNPAYEWDHRCDRVSAVDGRVKEQLFATADKLCLDNEMLLKDYAGVIRIQTENTNPFRGHMGRGGRYGFGPTVRLLDETARLQEIFDEKAARKGSFEACSSCSLLLPSLVDLAAGNESDDDVLTAYAARFETYLDLALLRPRAERPQQAMADALDKGSFVYLQGRNGNETDLVIALHELQNPRSESNFIANSGSDYLPGGSVFTIPVLSDTNGIFHTRHAILGGKKVNDLKITIEDGYVKEYSFDKETSEQGAEATVRTLMSGKNPLKISEFCVGTNTEGYGRYVRLPEGSKVLPEQMLAHFCPSIVIGDSRFEGTEKRILFSPTTHKQMIALTGDMERVIEIEPEAAPEPLVDSLISVVERTVIEKTEPNKVMEEIKEETTVTLTEKPSEQAEDAAIATPEEKPAAAEEPVSTIRTGKRTRLSIPFEEIGAVSMIKENGDRQDVIREGWFVLIGTDHLNLPLIDWKNELKERNEQSNG